MSSEAKIGLGIVLGALLVSVVLIGRTVTRKQEPVSIGNSPVASNPAEPAYPDSYGGDALAATGAQEHAGGPSSTPGTFGMPGESGAPMDRLVGGGTPDGLGKLPAKPAGGQALAAPDMPDAAKSSAPEVFGVDPSTVGKTGADKAADKAVDKPVAAKAVPKAKSAPAAGMRTYRVEQGDTLWSLADRFLGSGSRYKEILAANPGMSKDLRAGQKISIPAE